MTLHTPIQITARLCAGLRVGDGWLSIEYAKRPGAEHRTRYQYHIDGPGWEYTSDDLQSGNVRTPGLQAGLRDLCSFLSAAAESYQYHQRTGREGENEDLFPAHVVAWAAQHDDELSLLSCELEETPNLIQE